MKNKLLTILFGISIFLLIVSFSIALPIYCRFFYYLQINTLNLPKNTGYDYSTIKTAFDDVMNYLTLPWCEFGTGSLSYTTEGKAHFADCKGLFMLDTVVLIISFVLVLVFAILERKNILKFNRPFGMHVAFTSSISIFGFFIILIGLVSIDFEKAFVIFHKIFFPGKDNWQFTQADEIINILPQQFFMNCAILIASSIVIICILIITVQLVKKKRMKNKSEQIKNAP